ncbi:hypothetical protein [Achromobacter sp. SLBN-14]|uniref:hypothetical protein n=1 Tax=Achromobacter sp. SLBN-14 TaxID=2768442 RepID=UPI00114FEAE0|nr:hypothetical protein [Achromobacter sp. SLBN-14]
MSQPRVDFCGNSGHFSKTSRNFFFCTHVEGWPSRSIQAAVPVIGAVCCVAVTFPPRMQRAKNNRLSLASGDPVIEPMPA